MGGATMNKPVFDLDVDGVTWRAEIGWDDEDRRVVQVFADDTLKITLPAAFVAAAGRETADRLRHEAPLGSFDALSMAQQLTQLSPHTTRVIRAALDTHGETPGAWLVEWVSLVDGQPHTQFFARSWADYYNVQAIMREDAAEDARRRAGRAD